MLGTRPIATSTTSQSSVSDLPPAAGSSVSFTLLPLAVDLHHLGAELEGKPLLGQHALELLSHLAVEPGGEPRQHLDHGHCEPSRDQTEPSSSPI